MLYGDDWMRCGDYCKTAWEGGVLHHHGESVQSLHFRREAICAMFAM
jgi:hypothetical protein